MRFQRTRLGDRCESFMTDELPSTRWKSGPHCSQTGTSVAQVLGTGPGFREPTGLAEFKHLLF